MNQQLVFEWRAGFREETPVRLVVTAPPVTYSLHGRDVVTEEEPGSQVGMSLSAAMIRLLGHHEGYGLQFPVRRALADYRRYCEGKHRTWPDHRGEPLCWQLVIHLVIGQTSLKWAADQYEVSYPRAERLLENALDKMGTWIVRWEEQAA